MNRNSAVYLNTDTSVINVNDLHVPVKGWIFKEWFKNKAITILLTGKSFFIE